MIWLKSKLVIWGAAIGSFIMILLVAFLKGKKAAKVEVLVETLDSVIETSKKEKKIDKEIKSSSRAAKRERLRRYASDGDPE